MSWRKVKLGDVCTIEKGKIGIMKAVPGDFPLVVLGEERRSHNEFHFDGKAVIIPLVSSTGHGHRSLKRIHYEEGKFAVGDILCAVMPKNYNELDSMFLYRYLDVNKEKELVGRMKGMANVSLPIKSLAEIEIPLPSLHEQKTIIEKLSTINHQTAPLTSELTRQLDFVKQLRQAFLREAMQGKLVPQDPKDEPASELLQKIKAALRQAQDDKKGKKQKELPPVKENEIPFEIPENWVWCRLGEICDFITKGTTPDLSRVRPSDSIPFLKVYNIVNQRIDFHYRPQFIDNETHDKFLNRSKVFPGDVIMNIVGPPLGKVAIIPDDYPEWNINQALVIFRPIEKKINKYLYHYLCDGNCIKVIRTLGVVGQDNISLEQCRNIVIPLPPLPEQHRIVVKLEQLMQLCDGLKQSIRQSKEQTNMLLQSALREALKGECNQPML